MGILKFFKGKNHNDEERRRQEVNETAVEANHEAEQGTGVTDNTTTSPPSRRNSTLIRRVSSNSMRKLRRIGQALRLIGDDMERRSLDGSSTNIDAQDPSVTRNVINIVTQNNTDIDVAARNAANANTMSALETEQRECHNGDVAINADISADSPGMRHVSSDDEKPKSSPTQGGNSKDNGSNDTNRYSTEI